MAGEHSRDDLWERINDQSNQIGEVRSAQSATDARLAALESAVDTGFRTLSSELRSIGERVNRPKDPNYGILAAIAFGLLGMFGGYALLITAPLKSAQDRHDEQITELETHRQRTSSNEARLDALDRQVQQIDEHGPRLNRPQPRDNE